MSNYRGHTRSRHGKSDDQSRRQRYVYDLPKLAENMVISDNQVTSLGSLHHDRSVCSTGKRAYATKKAAIRVRDATVQRGQHEPSRGKLGVFKCFACDLWHVGHANPPKYMR